MKTVIIIPARLNSNRLPEKVLIDMKGKTMLQRVYERAIQSQLEDVYIATDSKKIKKVVQKFTKNIIMTSSEHSSGTDRIAEAAQKIDCDYIINIQGDEPLIEVALIDKLAKTLHKKKAEFVTAAYPLQKKEEILDTAKVKVVCNQHQQAIYFSRAPIPYSVDYQAEYYCHIGIYGYSKKFLLHYTKLPTSSLEKSEKLEQLRAIQAGYPILVVFTKQPSLSIDKLEDIHQVMHFFVD